MTGIYKIKNKINGKVYIGQSVNIPKRWKDHRKNSRMRNYEGKHYPLYRAFAKYGLDNFDFIILEKCEKEELNDKETQWILQYDSINTKKGYNLKLGEQPLNLTSKLTKEEAKEIQHLLLTTPLVQKDIGDKFGVSFRTVCGINLGETWRDNQLTYPLRQNKESNKNFCKDCKKEISSTALRCINCYNSARKKQSYKKRPKPVELARLVKEKGFEGVGRDFGITGNAVKRWCRDYQIPYLKKELVIWYNNQVGISNEPKLQIRKVKQIEKSTNKVINIFDNATAAARSLGKKQGNHISEVCNGIGKTAHGFKWEYINEKAPWPSG